MHRTALFILTAAITATTVSPAFAASTFRQLNGERLENASVSFDQLLNENLDKVDFQQLRRENLDKDAVNFDQLRDENLDKVDFQQLRRENLDKDAVNSTHAAATT